MNKPKFAAACIVFLLVTAYLPAFVATGGAIVQNSSFTVYERSGQNIENYLVQRGIPLDKGALFDTDRVFVTDGSTVYPCYARAMQKYDDGSIKWLSAAFEVSLEANGRKTFSLYKSNTASEQNISAEEQNGTVTLRNKVMTVTFSKSGMEQITYKNTDILKRGEKSVCIQENKAYIASGGSVRIAENNGVYVTVEVKMPYGESFLSCIKTYTVSANSNRIICRTTYVSDRGKYTASNSRFTKINALYESYVFSDGFSAPKYNKDGDAAWVTGNGITAALASSDVLKLRGGFGENGFFGQEGGIAAASLIKSGDYTWADGRSRTVTHEIALENENAEKLLNVMKNPPYVGIEPSRYVAAGLLKCDKISASAQAQAYEIKWGYKKNFGKQESGAIPFFVSSQENFAYNAHVMLGEIDYNTWFAQMALNDAELYFVLCDSTRTFMDLSVYEGADAAAHGIPRYRILNNGGDSLTGHLYYGEFSNLCLSYLMTGDAAYGDKAYEMADTMYKRTMNVKANTFGGYHLARAGSLNGNMRYERESYEIRNAFVIRALQFSSELFSDNRFSYLADQLCGYLAQVQTADGDWAQVVDENGNGVANVNGNTGVTSWVMYKNYINLYHIRGLCGYYEMTKNETALNTIQKFADYMIRETEGRGWSWDPCLDKEKCETGEDYSRGKSPIQSCMSAQVFALMYEETGDEKYFKAMCEALLDYTAVSRTSGFASARFNDKDYLDGAINTVVSGQNTTMLHMDSTYIKLFSDNAGLVKKLGFEKLAAVFNGARAVSEKIQNNYCYDEVTANMFETDEGRILIFANNSGRVSGIWDKNVSLLLDTGNSLWYGAQCRMYGGKTAVSKNMAYFETAMCYELPIKVSDNGRMKYTVLQYDSEAIKIFVRGTGEAELSVSNGEFEIKDGGNYSVLSENGRGGKYVTVTKGGSTAAAGGVLKINISADNDDYFNQINNTKGVS